MPQEVACLLVNQEDNIDNDMEGHVFNDDSNMVNDDGENKHNYHRNHTIS